MNGMTPSYLIDPVPKPRNHLYGFRLTNVIPSPPCRTERFQKSFYPDVINCWNNIGSNFRDTPTLPLFKSKILKIYRPVKKSIFGIHNPHGTRYIYQLRVGLSGLKSHKKSHNVSDKPDDNCSFSTGSENLNHFLLKCPLFINQREKLRTTVNPILSDLASYEELDLSKILLYGHKGLTFNNNRTILKATIKFILDTKRFSEIS